MKIELRRALAAVPMVLAVAAPVSVRADVKPAPGLSRNGADAVQPDILQNLRVPNRNVPLPGAYGATTTQQPLTAQTLNIGATVDILNISPGTPGYVASLWFAMGNPVGANAAQLKVYVDNESTPSISTDLGTLFGTSKFAGTVGMWSNNRISVQINSDIQLMFKIPIPFKSSVRITLTGAAASTSIFANAYVQTGIDLKEKLYSSYTQMAGVTPSQQANGTVKFLNLASGSGKVIYHSTVYGNATDQTYLEPSIQGYLNGLVPNLGVVDPQFKTTGGEDYYLDGYYCMGGLHSDMLHFCYTNGNSSVFAVDHLEHFGGIQFDNGILLQMDRGDKPANITDTNVDINSVVFYTTPNA